MNSTSFPRHFDKTLPIRRVWTACLGPIFLLAMSGCASLQVHMGMKVYLDRTPVASMKAIAKGAGIGPGEKVALVALFTQPDGKVLQTEGAGQGKVMWKDLKVTATVAVVNQKGVVSLPKDPRISDGRSHTSPSLCPAILTCAPILTFQCATTRTTPQISRAAPAPAA